MELFANVLDHPVRKPALPPLFGYGVSVLGVALILLLALYVPAIGNSSPLLFFLLAVSVSAWYGGVKPGLLATGLAVLSSIFWGLMYPLSFAAGQWLQLVGFLAVAGVILQLASSQRQHPSAPMRHAAEERFTKVFQASPLIITLSRVADGRLIEVNESFVRTTGYQRGEVLGRTPVEVGLWIEPTIRSDIQQRLQTSQPVRNIETRFRMKDGCERICLISAELLDVHGERCVLSVVSDITERKAAEEASRASEARLNNILQNIPAAVYMLSPDHRYLFVNRAFEQENQITNEAIRGLSIYDRFAPDVAAALVANEEEVLRTKVPLELEEVAPRDGKLHYYTTVKAPLFDAAGEPYAVLGVSIDITARKNAEQRERALVEQAYAAKAKFEAVFNQSGIFAGVMDVNGCLREANQLSTEACGYTKEMVLNRPFWETPWWRQSEAVKARIRTATEQAAAGEVFREILPYWWADGSERVVDFAMYPIRDQVGRVALLHPTGIDITVRKQTEAEREQLLQALATERAHLKTLTATLEQQVQERTAELTKRLHELDQFAYVTSHDLKAPLRAIDHLAHWISDDAAALLPPKSREHLEKMRGRISRMDRLLDDLLDYSRADRYKYDTEKVDVAELFDEIVHLVTPPQGFAVSHATPLPVLRTPKTPLETVLRNLISNAIKHHDRSDGQVQVAVQELGGWFAFEVCDDGPGIAPEFHERIFQVFQTLKPRDTVEGSGMGLAIVKKIVEARGGAITVASSLGQGATFRFTWPKG